MLPNFLIVGAPKAGTTSLYHYLSMHPQVYMSPVKEPNFFSYDEIKTQRLYYREKWIESLADYERLFAHVKNQKAIGEASVSYLWYPDAASRIKRTIPTAKIIIILRNPIDRGLSHYLMDQRLGYVKIPFEDIVYKRGGHELLPLYYQQYVELGLYYWQVKRYLDLFDRLQVKIFLFEDLKNNTAGLVQELFAFLGIEEQVIMNVEKTHNAYIEPRNKYVEFLYSFKVVRRLARSVIGESALSTVRSQLFGRGEKPKLAEQTRTYLSTLYRPDIANLESIIDRDLSGWR